jgi:30S ribosomal protein 3
MPNTITLKVLWSGNLLGLGLDQTIKKEETGKFYSRPFTQYFFWPRTRAWDQLNDALTAAMWITNEQKIAILNVTSVIIENWQTDQSKVTKKMLENKFPNVVFVEINS